MTLQHEYELREMERWKARKERGKLLGTDMNVYIHLQTGLLNVK